MPDSTTPIHKPFVPVFHARAAYACDPSVTRGRLLPEDESPTRSPFQRDRDRIVHAGAFRKLKYKTQVFVYHEGDYFRTRLTHSLEVAQIARSISRQLGLDEDLAEAVALAHDLGHTPFGHAGEDAMHEVMAPYGGFDHNDQTIRVLTELEARYAGFEGLNLTWETLEGVAKHNGPLVAEGMPDVPPTIAGLNKRFDLQLDSYASLEAQVAALADDIAYNNHDLDDGLRAGFFDLDDVAELPLVGDLIADVREQHPGLAEPRLIHEVIRRMINRMVEDVIGNARTTLMAMKPASADEIRQAGRTIIRFSDNLKRDEKSLRDFLATRMYRHYKVNRVTSKARRIVQQLFEIFFNEPGTLPTEWQAAAGRSAQAYELAGQDPDAGRARIICDYIAGMTDRYAMKEYQRLFDLSFEKNQ
ncbi:MAG TPA: deoxyguanosinetriphosphate triphosphohydrolase [Rhodospirillaceae bacterium]|nr:deoxyguanosinetriphosphate triphosphohydrolase [Alphaproteobacteria bacterium]OUT42419.1 MAG: deoxyguanosinetriphosphate triphosphohydrolase [Micavibrio sp. TMED2]HCI46083.1 deoxyguanosinetriphosphate triphosphohydrolase [Rhodospirillaceae bacterium]MAS45941.1 deoxyguanosinetriphosphate triphosphohydrolase [Alphaproteobacteria bacterium]MAX95877.1 deoxyguanosinetriphosphate triphosphohydrolase [Alphaproteobacteria bacterium]|tara:strand:+ start:18627 stop:19874 length:1248 start_codon:yes stop_codon:yes gene_type:complete